MKYFKTIILLGMFSLLLMGCTSGFDSRFNNLFSSDHNGGEPVNGSYSLEDLQRFDKGVSLYHTKNCVQCHGEILTSTKRGMNAETIFGAPQKITSMSSIQLTQEEAEMIAYALGEIRERIVGGLDTGNSETPAPRAPDLPVISFNQKQFQCDNEKVRGKADIGMQRLTKTQLINTWTDAFGDSVVSSTGSLIRLSEEFFGPDEFETSPFSDKSQLEALFLIAQELGVKVSDNPGSLEGIHPCLNNEIDLATLSNSCLDQVIPELGQRLFRRPLNDTEVSKFKTLIKNAPTELGTLNAKSQISLLISRLLVTPQAHYIFPTWTQTIDGRSVIGWSTVIQRLSFGVTDGPPDDELMSNYSQMSNLDIIREQARRLARTPRGRAKFRKIMKSWLRLDEAVEVADIPAKEFGITPDQTKQILEEMKTEALDFAEYIAFDHPGGTVEDLLTQPLGFPKSEPMKKILGASMKSQGEPVSTPQHLGVLNRPALLADSSQKGNVIHRGLVYRLHFLCDTFSEEDIPDNINEAFEEGAGKVDFFQSTARDLAHAGTSSPTCIGCHKTINSIGYALGNFGPLGQYQEEERVFNDNGEFLHTLPIDSSATNTQILSSGETVQGHRDLADKMANSYKFKACFSRHLLKRLRGRMETGWDNCQLSELETAMHNKEDLLNIYLRSIVSEDIFWKGL